MFSKEKINMGRQPELDIARGLAVLFMIVIHVQTYFSSPKLVDTYFADFNDYMGDIPAAPMFMFLLGVGINYSRKNTPKLMAFRGIGLLLTAYLLNFIRGFLPSLIKGYSFDDMGYIYEGISELLFIDILQFSGLALLMFAAFQKFKFNKIAIIITAIIFGALNLILLNIQVENIGLQGLTGLFWGSFENSFFPFLSWMFYPIGGYIFGSYLIRCKDKKKLYIRLGAISLLIFIGGIFIFNVLLNIPTGMNSEIGYYHHFFTDNITFTAGVLVELSLISFIVKLIPAQIQRVGFRWSKNVTSIYCIHWVIITWTTLFISYNSLDLIGFLILLIIIIVITDISAIVYERWKKLEHINSIHTAIPVLVGAFILTIILLSFYEYIN